MLANIEIYTYMVCDSRHFYGELNVFGDTLYELTRKITQDEIDRNPDRFFAYREGDNTNAFNSWRDVVEAGRKLCEEKGIDLDKVEVSGIPNNERMPYRDAIGNVDTRMKCKRCGHIFENREPLYNLPLEGPICIKCYDKKGTKRIQ